MSRFDWIQEEYPPLMRASEAKEILRCGRRQIYQILDEHPDLKVQVNTRSIRVIRDELITWLESGGYQT